MRLLLALPVIALTAVASVAHADPPPSTVHVIQPATIQAPPAVDTSAPSTAPLPPAVINARLAALRAQMPSAHAVSVATSPPDVPISFNFGPAQGLHRVDQRGHDMFVTFGMGLPVGVSSYQVVLNPNAQMFFQYGGKWGASYLLDCAISQSGLLPAPATINATVAGGPQETIAVESNHALVAWRLPAAPSAGAKDPWPVVLLSARQSWGLIQCSLQELLPGQ